MSKKIPRFRSERAEREFWDRHDSTEYLDQLADDDETVFVRPENGVIEVNAATWRRLLKAAQRRRTTPSQLVNAWLRQKLAANG